MIDDYEFTTPGKIVHYDPVEQLSKILLSNDKTYSNSDEADRQVSRVLLEDVPTYTPGGGGWHMTFPIKEGDNCLVSFSKTGYDHWLFDNKDAAGRTQDGQPQPWTRRRFSLRDGFAQVGWNNIPTAISDYHPDDAEFRNADREQRVSLLEGGDIHIKAGATTVNVSKDGAITMVATDVDVTAATSTFNGDLHCTGTISAPNIDATTAITTPVLEASTSLKALGVEVILHKHSNPEGGFVGPMEDA